LSVSLCGHQNEYDWAEEEPVGPVYILMTDGKGADITVILIYHFVGVMPGVTDTEITAALSRFTASSP